MTNKYIKSADSKAGMHRVGRPHPLYVLIVALLPAVAFAQTTPVAPAPGATGVRAQAAAGNAQSEPATPKEPVQPAENIPQVNVVGQHYANGIGTSDAASEGVILGELLQDRPLLRPGEVLEAVPGLVVTQHSGDGKANQYFLRGYNLDHGTDFATSVDGVPVNMPTNAHGQGYTDLNFLIPELVDHIDYRKGTYFAENGDFSAAGSANVQYRNSIEPFAQLTEGGGGYQRGVFGGSTTLTAPVEKDLLGNNGPTLLGGLELMEENGPWTLPESMRKVNGLVRLSDGTHANGWSIDAIDYQAHWNSTDQVPLSLIEAGQLGRFSALDPTDGGDSGRSLISGEWHAHDADRYEKVNAYWEHSRMQLWSDFSYFELRPTTGDQFSQLENRDTTGIQAVQGWKHELFGQDSVTEAGLQVRHDYIHVSLLDTEARVPFDYVNDDLVSETEVGVYVQNTTAWTNWFRSVFGLRADRVTMNMASLSNALNSGNAAGNKISPKMALVFGPWNKTEFFVDAGEGFHSNDARGVIDTVDPTTGIPLLSSQRAPALVSAWGSEIGMKTEAISGLQTSMALWHLNSGSELVYVADSDIGSMSANGSATRYGFEWNNHMAVNQWVLLDADFAWTHARYTVDNDNGAIGNFIPNAVPRVATIGLTVNHWGPWSGEINTRYIGGYPLSQDGTWMGPSAIVTNLRVQRDIRPNLSVSLNVLNLFNREYYDIAYEQDYQLKSQPVVPAVPWTPGFSGPAPVTVHPGEPREFRLTLRYQF